MKIVQDIQGSRYEMTINSDVGGVRVSGRHRDIHRAMHRDTRDMETTQ